MQNDEYDFHHSRMRSNYECTYQMKLFISNTQIPMEPRSLFLGMKLDMKLS